MKALLKKYLQRQINGFHGFVSFFRLELNSWILAGLTAAVIAAGIYKDIDTELWPVLIISLCIMWIAEIINTSIEELADVINPERNSKIRKVKDMAGFAVFVCYVMFIAVILMIFFA